MAEGSRYRGLQPNLAAEIQRYETQYFREDKPIPFCGLLVYPATVHDYEAFCNCTTCLTMNKNKTPAGIRMTYLQFLCTEMQKQDDEGAFLSYQFQKLCEIIFHIENGIKCKNTKCNTVITYDSPIFKNYLQKIQQLQEGDIKDINNIEALKCPQCGGNDFIEMIKFVPDSDTKKIVLWVDGHKITAKDFERLRHIVLFQNFPDYYDDSWVDDALREDHEAKMKIQNKDQNLHATLEKKIVALSIATNYKFDEIFNMSIRKFTMALSTVDDLINYKIIKTAAMSGFVQLPKDFKLEHWIYKSDVDIYGDSYKDADSLKSEVNNL